MSRIVRNSVLNGLALGLTSVLSILLVPVLIRQYGLEAYGLIPMLRFLTPLGAMGIVLLALPQMATRAAGLYGSQGEQTLWQRSQSALVGAAALLGLFTGAALLAIGPENFAAWLNVKPGESEAFSIGFTVIALLMPLLTASTVVFAALSGLGHFRTLRAIEVASYLVYFAAAATSALLGAPLLYVLIGLFTADACRALALLVYGKRIGQMRGRALIPDFRWLADHKQDLIVFSSSSLLGYTRKHLAAGSIAFLLGPSALGLYDAIERVPRALKTLLGLVNTAVLPHTMRLDASDDEIKLRSLLVRGTRLVLLCALPVACAVMVYATPLLSVWLGERYAYGGPFLILLMVPFVLDLSISLVSTATLSRLHLVAQQNTITIMEILALLAVLVVLTSTAEELAPYAASAVAGLTGYALRVRALVPAYGISTSLWLTVLAKALFAGLIGAALVFAAAGLFGLGPIGSLLTLPLGILLGAALNLVLWTADERRDLHSVISSLRGLVARKAVP